MTQNRILCATLLGFMVSTLALASEPLFFESPYTVYQGGWLFKPSLGSNAGGRIAYTAQLEYGEKDSFNYLGHLQLTELGFGSIAFRVKERYQIQTEPGRLESAAWQAGALYDFPRQTLLPFLSITDGHADLRGFLYRNAAYNGDQILLQSALGYRPTVIDYLGYDMHFVLEANYKHTFADAEKGKWYISPGIQMSRRNLLWSLGVQLPLSSNQSAVFVCGYKAFLQEPYWPPWPPMIETPKALTPKEKLTLSGLAARVDGLTNGFHLFALEQLLKQQGPLKQMEADFETASAQLYLPLSTTLSEATVSAAVQAAGLKLTALEPLTQNVKAVQTKPVPPKK